MLCHGIVPPQRVNKSKPGRGDDQQTIIMIVVVRPPYGRGNSPQELWEGGANNGEQRRQQIQTGRAVPRNQPPKKI